MYKKALLAVFIMANALSTSASIKKENQQSYSIAGYRFPAALFTMLQSGMTLPVLIENIQQEKSAMPDANKYISIGNAELFTANEKLLLRNIHINRNEDSQVQLTDDLLAKLDNMSEQAFDNTLNAPVTDYAGFTLDGKQMRLVLTLSRKAFGTLITPRQYDLDGPSSNAPSGTLTYNFGGYSNESASGDINNSGYLNFNSTMSLGIDHLRVNGSAYTGNRLSSDRSGQINTVLWERDYKGLRTAAGMLDSWSMQSVGSVTALTGGEIYGFSIGNAASSRKRKGDLSLAPIIAFFPASGEARIRRDGNLLSIQRFPVGNHEIDTSMLPYGIYTAEVEVINGGRRVSTGLYQINKPFTPDMSDAMQWQFWGAAYHKDKLYNYHDMDDEVANPGRLNSANEKKMTPLFGVSVGKSLGPVNWNISSYTLGKQAVGELSAYSNMTDWLSLNTQTMSATDGSWRGNYGGTLRLPFSIGSVWYNRNLLHSGQLLALYDSRGSNWGASVNLPSIGPASGGVISWTEDRDDIYGYKRRRIDYSQGVYAGRHGSVRLRTGLGYSAHSYGSQHYSDRERYVMLNLSVPLGNHISMAVAHARESGTAMNIDASRTFQGDYIKSVSASLSKSLNSGVDRGITGGTTVSFDTPFNTNVLSYQAGSRSGWNSTLTSEGSLAWSGIRVAAGKGQDSAGLLIDTGLKRGEKITLDVNGTKHQLQGDRNYISLPPYGQYRMELINNADTLDSYDISDGARRTLSVYPGNVVYLQPEVKRIITLFGRLINADGSVAANRQIKNRLGLAQTESDGRFVIDIDRNNPQLNIATSDDSICALELNISTADGALWLGDVKCDRQNHAWQQITTQEGKTDEATRS